MSEILTPVTRFAAIPGFFLTLGESGNHGRGAW